MNISCQGTFNLIILGAKLVKILFEREDKNAVKNKGIWNYLFECHHFMSSEY